MFNNFFKITVRNLFKNKIYSFINIFGLSIGISCFILISLFVKDELTFDQFNSNYDRIFRINTNYKIGDNRFNLANSPAPLAKALVDEYPEIDKSTRLLNNGNVYVKKGDEYIKEENFLYADSSLFEVFTLEFISGNSNTCLKEPNSIVITEESAEKYFSKINPLGEVILLSNGKEFIVKGIVKSPPYNSHFWFDFLASFNTLPEGRDDNWFGGFVHNYVLTNSNKITSKQLDDKIFSVTEKYVGPIIKAGFGVGYQEFLDNGNDYSFNFVPLSSIHLYSKVFNEFKDVGNINTIYVFTAIAFFILLIACINFINLATAKSVKRANEVGVRKVMGSNKIQLIKQFLSESILLCFVAIIFSIVIVEITLPYFNELTFKRLSMEYFNNFYTIPLIIIFTVILGIISGIYPAIVLASYKPVAVLKGKIFRNPKKISLRRGLVVFQFTTSIVLFIGTFIIYNQMEYIKNKNLGFNKDQVLVIQNIADLSSQQFAFVNTIKENSNVLNASLSQGLPTYSLSANIYRKEDLGKEDQTLITIAADYNFLDTYKFEMKEGRYFNKEITTDTASIILNESAVKKINMKDPIGSRLISNLGEHSTETITYSVIGIVKDFNLQSLKEEIRPSAFIILRNPNANFLSIKLSGDNIENTVDFIKKKWKEFGQSKPIEYTFFDENYDDIYRAEIQAGKVITVFSILAIIIACLGLFGLAAFTAEQRTKEIGIRKVLGSSISQIFLLLSQEFVKWVLISNIIAWPIAYYIMNKWLEDFVYRTEINLLFFGLAGLVTLLIALATVSYQSIKAALANPIKSLRYE